MNRENTVTIPEDLYDEIVAVTRSEGFVDVGSIKERVESVERSRRAHEAWVQRQAAEAERRKEANLRAEESAVVALNQAGIVVRFHRDPHDDYAFLEVVAPGGVTFKTEDDWCSHT